jgi:uncharacterized protein
METPDRRKGAMECPVCQKPLHEMTAGAIKVQACSEGCGGLWFDARELRNAEGATETETAALLAISAIGPAPPPPDRLRCPRDPEVVMQRHFESAERRVTVNACPQCGGTWLDLGELGVILEGFRAGKTERGEAQAALEMTLKNMMAVQSTSDERAFRDEFDRTPRFLESLVPPLYP